jgi:hypothetical protein
MCLSCGGATVPPPPLMGSASTVPAACAVGEGATNRCWASDDEHEPLWTNGRVELTSLLHVPKDFDARGCKLVVRWRGSESGSEVSDQPTVTDDGVRHWRLGFALRARDVAVRLEQTVACPNGGEFSLTAHFVVGDTAGHRVCAAPLGAGTVTIAAGDNQVVFTAKPNVMLRAQGTTWVDRCTSQPILDTAALPAGSMASFIPDGDDLTDGERFLAVRSAGAASGPVPEELTVPSAIFHFDHNLTDAEAHALAATLASASGALEIQGSHANPRPL